MPHVLDVIIVLEHIEHLLEKKAAISAHLSEAHSSVMQMYVTVELDTIIIAYRAKNCKQYSSGAVKTSVYIYMVPVITVVTSVLILHEPVTLLSVAGMLLALAGLGLSEWKGTKKRPFSPVDF